MTTKRPNILMFMSDNQPAELLASYGNEEISTPNLDAFAADAFQLNNAFCVNGMCSPCRASVMTGLMPSQHGLHTWIDDRLRHLWPDNWNPLNEFKTLPTILSDHGYETALMGKYHMGLPDQAQNGFQHWVTSPHGHVTDFWDGTYIVNGETEKFAGHSVDFFTNKTIEYLNNVGEEPFFAFVPYNAPYGHWPALKGRARNRFRDMYDNVPMNSIPREGLHENAIARFLRKASDSVGGIDHSSELRIPNDLETLRNYYSEMSMVDDGVGRVLSTLKSQGLYEDTLIIYTSDHGFSLGHHGIWGHSQATLPSNAHEATFSIPLILRFGDRLLNSKSDHLISQVDLFPTILEFAGIDPKPHIINSPAVSFAASLETGVFEKSNEVFMEQEETRAIRTSQWLYKRRFQLAPTPAYKDELYDLIHDPEERINLCDHADFLGIKIECIEKIDQFFDHHNNPKYDLWQGGTPQSNSDKPWLWKEAWGDEWAPKF